MMLSIAQFGAALAKICRWGGRGRFASDLLHSFVVSDLLPDEYKWDGLMHDSTEVFCGDANLGWKSPSMREAENRLLDEIYDHFGLTHATKRAHRAVKIADDRSARGEVWSGIGDASVKKSYPLRDKEAEKLHLFYFNKYSVADLTNPNGRAVAEFIRRFKRYRKLRERPLRKAA